jgi:hypothetical protein
VEEETVNIKIKYMAVVFLVLTASLALVYNAYKNRFRMEGLLAPVIVNIEVSKPYMNNYCVMTQPGGRVFPLSPTDAKENDLPNTVVFTEMNGLYIQKLFVKSFDKQNVTSPIDNITVFVGNKTFYYPNRVIETWESTETEDGVLLQLPVEPYAKSIIRPWINWYGDLNFALKAALALFAGPVNFFILFVCFLFCVILAGRDLRAGFESAVKNHATLLEISCLLLLLVLAFLLRIDGLTRHSAWADELYSSTVAANPHLPLLNAFKDPGNPPLFFLLLRLWHELFGWTESSGRMLVALIGLAGIVSLYCFVKPLCGRKHAFVSALLLTVSISHIGYSNEIRAYILMMALAPVVSRLFFCLMEQGSVKRYVVYMLAGAALANTHYYGILLIGFNFIYYIIIHRKQLFTRETVIFLAVNGMIALSVLPFFIIGAGHGALMDSNFNTWIPKLDEAHFSVFIRIFLVCLALTVIKRRSKTVRNILDRHGGMCEYAVYACSFIYITAYIVSLKRVILLNRYLSICLPFIFAVLPLVVFTGWRGGKVDALIRFLLVFVLINFSCHFEYFGRGYSDVYKEAQEYINADAVAHSLRVSEYEHWVSSDYYNLAKITPYTGKGEFDVVYMAPLHFSKGKNEMLQRLSTMGRELDGEDILWIRATRGQYILKKYLIETAGGS